MNMPEPDNRLEAWERWERPAIAALPYVMLVITTGIGLIIYTGSEGTLLIDLGLVGLAAGLLVTFTLWQAVRERPAFMAVYFTAMIMVMALLVIRSPWFGFFTFTGYFYAYYIPVGRWRLLAVAAVALVTATSQAGGLPRHTPAGIAIWVVIVCINLLVAESLTWFGWVSSEQNDRRSYSSPSSARPTGSSPRRWRRTSACTPSCWRRPGRPVCWTSGSGWPAKSTTPWPRD
jgi:hypothetical protein